MKLRNGAHIDRILDVNPEATLAIAQHNASSPLLKLPLEVKNLIYKYAFGGNLIHIIKNPDQGAAEFKNTICRAVISEEEAPKFENETIYRDEVSPYEGRHNYCRFQESPIFGDEEQKPQVLSLSALRCCRQMYNEAHHVPYSTNTFSCADPHTLQDFVLFLAKGKYDNHLALHSLSMEMAYNDFHSNRDWSKALNTCAKQLKNLKNVNISLGFNSDFWMPWALSSYESEAVEARWNNFFRFDLFVLKKLPLRSATFMISGRSIFHSIFHGSSYYFGMFPIKLHSALEDKHNWARYVIKLIMK